MEGQVNYGAKTPVAVAAWEANGWTEEQSSRKRGGTDLRKIKVGCILVTIKK